MQLSPRLRRALLIAALVATLLAVYWASRLPGGEARREPVAGAQPERSSLDGAREARGGAAGKVAVDPMAGAQPERSRPDSTRPDSTRRDSARRDSTRQARADTADGAPASGPLDLTRLQRSRSAEPSDDLFGPRDFAPAPPPAPKRPIAQPADVVGAPPPLPPPAPPVPFTYLGRLAEGPQTTVFLAAGDRNLVVKLGDVIDNTYRVDEVGERVLVLTYLPQNLKQPIPIGAP